MTMRREKHAGQVLNDLSSAQSLKQFREGAAAFTSRATQSKAAALKLLVQEGIVTRSGKLTKNYRPD
jgi:hypothetical protein